MNNNITNEQIVQSARRQRQAAESQMSVAPWRPRRRQGRITAAIVAVAASLVSFIAGYGIRGKASQPEALPLAQSIVVQHDTIRQVATVRDTIYQTRIVTRYAQPVIAQQDTTVRRGFATPIATSPEQMACSMLCDNIPYELLATP
jgi:hypothetical protein